MKRIVLFLLAVLSIANIANAQSFELKQLSKSEYGCSRISTMSWTRERWEIESINVLDEEGVYIVTIKLYRVEESKYVEVPNDTIRKKLCGYFRKYTLRDGTGYHLVNLKDKSTKIEVTEFSDEVNIEVRFQENEFYVYNCKVWLSPEMFELYKIKPVREGSN